MLGLGGGTMQSFLSAQCPGSHVTTVEASSAVVEAARRFFGFDGQARAAACAVSDPRGEEQRGAGGAGQFPVFGGFDFLIFWVGGWAGGLVGGSFLRFSRFAGVAALVADF